MAFVGTAYVRVQAITTGFGRDVQKAVDDLGAKFANFNNLIPYIDPDEKLSPFLEESKKTYESINGLISKSYYLQAAIGSLGPVLSSAVSGLFAFGSQIAAMTPALIVLPGVIAGIGQAFIAAKLAFSGVGKAIGALNKQKSGGVDKIPGLLEKVSGAQRRLDLAERRRIDAEKQLKDAQDAARESLQQLGFEAEGAALSQKRAALNLEKARIALKRVQDLPPNNRARKEAELAFAEADLAYRKAIDHNTDLQKEVDKRTALGVNGSDEVVRATQNKADAQYELIKANKDLAKAIKELEDAKKGKGGGAGADPLKGLSASAAEFAKHIAALKPQFDSLKAAAGEKMFPGMTDAIDRLVKDLFPMLKVMLRDTGEQLGNMASELSKVITSKENLQNLNTVFAMNKDTIGKLGKVIGNLITAALQLLAAAKPLVDRFTDWVVALTDSWKAAHDTKSEMDGLTKTFNNAGDIAAQFGRILGNLFGGLLNLGKAASGAGSGGEKISNSFEAATKRFKEFTEAGLKDGSLKKFFNVASENFLKLMGILGKIIKAFIGLGDDPGTGEFLDSIGRGVDVLIPGIEKLSETAPSFGRFLENFMKFTAAFLESESIKTFFNIMSRGLEIVTKLFSDPTVQKIIGFIAVFHAGRLAIGKFGSGLKTVAAYMTGDFINAFTMVGKIKKFWNIMYSAALDAPILGNAIAGVATQLELMFPTWAAATSSGSLLAVSFGLIIAAAAAVIAIFIALYTQSKIFRDAIGDLVSAVGGALKGAFESVKEALGEVFKSGSGLMDIFNVMGDILGLTIIPLLQFGLVGAIGLIGDVFAGVVRIIGGGLSFVASMIMYPIDMLKALFLLLTGQPGKAADVFIGAFRRIKDSLVTIFRGVVGIILSPFRLAINFIIDLWNNTIGKIKFTVPSWVPVIGGKGFSVPNIPKWDQAMPALAKGGVVYPTGSGSLVRVAEAGRPERIEPLDKDGLSKRDRAIIQQLAGGGATINVYPSAGMDEVELASLVNRQISFQLRKGAA